MNTRIPLMAGCASAAAALLLLASGPASAATLNVCPSGCQYTQLAPALAAAGDGDTIRIGPGTYDGGVTIDVSVSLVGAGAGRTTISGGGPVLTIGEFGADAEPTVSIEGVTITGGVTQSSPESVPFTGQEGVIAAGGGVEIPPNADFSGGATVRIANSVITGNRVAPSATAPFGPPCPGGDPCPYAAASGGGIDSWGTLTLTNTTVSDNRIGSASGLSTLASDVDGGAITSLLGPLTIDGSVIHGNQASATGANGRFVEGGAINVSGRTMRISNSAVTGNSAALAASLPNSVDLGANGGAMHLTGDASVAISRTTVSGNSISMTNTLGDAEAFSGGIHANPDVDFTMSNSVVADNSVSSATLAGSSGDAEGDSGAGEILGTISNTRVTGNTVTVTAAAGDATAFAGAFIDFGSITNSLISGNQVHASSPGGTAFAAAGAIVVDEPGLTLRNSEVSGNTVGADGAAGSAQGGGIFDAPIPDGPPGGPLKLLNSGVTGNALSGSSGMALQGGGLFIDNEPLALTHSFIAGNAPDQCFGC